MGKHNINKIHRSILKWYSDYGRDLPWRKAIISPYDILVSEFMIQQTNVNRVLAIYPSFMNQFPTIDSLSNASLSDVIKAWRGLGYNRRAVNLHRTANIIMDNYDGHIPHASSKLIKMPGIGEYTAAAISNFAFKINIPVADINIRRVLGRINDGPKPTDIKRGWELAEKYLTSSLNSSNWHQAIMDLGSAICTSKKAKCSSCPVNNMCISAYKLTQYQNPNLKTRDLKIERFEGSTRYYRGKIINALRDSSIHIHINTIIETLEHDLIPINDHALLKKIIKQLEKDGLLELNNQYISLPK